MKIEKIVIVTCMHSYAFKIKIRQLKIIHCPPKVKVQPALLFSSFVHNSSINEFKNMKLIEHICYEMINLNFTLLWL